MPKVSNNQLAFMVLKDGMLRSKWTDNYYYTLGMPLIHLPRNKETKTHCTKHVVHIISGPNITP